MRLRRKPWARPELAACPFFIGEPKRQKGIWKDAFLKADQPMHLELGCGKGLFIALAAFGHPAINYIGIDLKSEVLGLAKRYAEKVYSGQSVHNLRLTNYDVERIDSILSPEDRIETIYINFCNPWPKQRDAKHRLTHGRQLEKYKTFLLPGGKLIFKTDDRALFEATQRYLAEAGFCITEQISGLPCEKPPCLPMSEHEIMFREQKAPIYRIIAAR